MSEAYDTGRDPLNAALDRLRAVVLRGDTTKVALLAVALEVLKASDRDFWSFRRSRGRG